MLAVDKLSVIRERFDTSVLKGHNITIYQKTSQKMRSWILLEVRVGLDSIYNK